MKAIFALFFIVAFIGMAMAGVHHYKIQGNGGQAAAPPGIFDLAAKGLNDVGSAIGGFFG